MYQDEGSSSLEWDMVFVFKLCVLFSLSNFKIRKEKLPKKNLTKETLECISDLGVSYNKRSFWGLLSRNNN